MCFFLLFLSAELLRRYTELLVAVRAAEATLGLKSRTTLELVRRPGTRGEEAKGSLFKHNKQEVNQITPINSINSINSVSSVNSVNSVNRITRRAGDEARGGGWRIEEEKADEDEHEDEHEEVEGDEEGGVEGDVEGYERKEGGSRKKESMASMSRVMRLRMLKSSISERSSSVETGKFLIANETGCRLSIIPHVHGTTPGAAPVDADGEEYRTGTARGGAGGAGEPGGPGGSEGSERAEGAVGGQFLKGFTLAPWTVVCFGTVEWEKQERRIREAKKRAKKRATKGATKRGEMKAKTKREQTGETKGETKGEIKEVGEDDDDEEEKDDEEEEEEITDGSPPRTVAIIIEDVMGLGSSCTMLAPVEETGRFVLRAQRGKTSMCMIAEVSSLSSLFFFYVLLERTSQTHGL